MPNPAELIVSPATPVYRGTTYFAQANITEKRLRKGDTKPLTNSGRKIATVADLGFEITIPIIAPFVDLVPLLQTWAALSFGRACAPHIIPVEAINTGTEVLTSTAHPLLDSDPVNLIWDETPPTLSAGGVSKTTTYFYNKLTADTGSLHPTAEDAAGNSNALNFTAAGVGLFALTKAMPLTLDRRSGVRRTYLNVAPVKFPTVRLAGGQLVWQGNLVFRAYPGTGKLPSDGDGAFYTEAPQEYVPPTWDTADALTSIPTSVAWGGAPWADIHSEQGFELSFEPTLKELANQFWPVATGRLTGFDAKVKFTPLGITRPQFEAIMAEQLGAQIAGSNAVITLSTHVVTLYNALLLSEPEWRSSVEDTAVGEMELTAHGNATSDNKPPFLIAAV